MQTANLSLNPIPQPEGAIRILIADWRKAGLKLDFVLHDKGSVLSQFRLSVAGKAYPKGILVDKIPSEILGVARTPLYLKEMPLAEQKSLEDGGLQAALEAGHCVSVWISKAVWDNWIALEK
jgi:hypothetical protein